MISLSFPLSLTLFLEVTHHNLFGDYSVVVTDFHLNTSAFTLKAIRNLPSVLSL